MQLPDVAIAVPRKAPRIVDDSLDSASIRELSERKADKFPVQCLGRQIISQIASLRRAFKRAGIREEHPTGRVR